MSFAEAATAAETSRPAISSPNSVKPRLRLRRVRPRDAHGNVVVGDVTIGPDVRDCVLWAEGEPLTVLGARDLVVVHANGRMLVTGPGRAEQLKAVVLRG